MEPFESPVCQNGVRPILILILGQRGNGKSTLAAALMPGLAPPEETVLIDPQGTLAVKLQIPRENPAINDTAVEEVLAPYLAEAEQTGIGRFFAFDEFDLYCTPVGYLGGRDGSIYKLINVARGWGCGTLAICRGSSQVAKNYIANADLLFVGRTNEPNAIKYLRELFGNTSGLDYDELLRTLPPHVFLAWSPRTGYGGLWIVKAGVLTEATESDLGLSASEDGTDDSSPGGAASVDGGSTDGAPPPADSATPATEPSASRTPASTRPR